MRQRIGRGQATAPQSGLDTARRAQSPPIESQYFAAFDSACGTQHIDDGFGHVGGGRRVFRGVGEGFEFDQQFQAIQMGQSVGQGGNPRAVMRDLTCVLAAIIRAGADAPDIVCGELSTCQLVDQRCRRLDIGAFAVAGDGSIEIWVVMKNGHAVRGNANIELNAG